MYSRVVKALKKLGVKCTAAGTEVKGDNVDGLLECIAEHYAEGGGLITPIIGTEDNIVAFRDLATGLYTLHGHFTPYKGSNVYTSAPYPVLTSVINDGDISYVQIFFPYKNQVQYFEVKDNWHEQKSISLWQQVIPVSDFQTACEFMAKSKVGKECETLSEVLEAVGDRFKVAKLVLNATDSETGEALANATLRSTEIEQWADGNYYLPAWAETIKFFAECDGYTSQYISVLATPEEVAAGEKIISLALVAKTE